MPTFRRNHFRRCALAEGFDLSVLLDEYRDEAFQQLDLLDAALLTLERAGSLPESDANELLRALHTLKGNSGMLGLAPVRDFVHALEDVLRSPPPSWTQPQLDALFAGAAALRRAVERAGTEGQEEAFTRLAAVAPDVLRAGTAAAGPAHPAPALPTADVPPAPGGKTAPQTVAPVAEPETAGAGGPGGAGELLRIPFAKLDALLNQVGELIQAASALEEVTGRCNPALEAAGVRRDVGERVEAIGRIAETLRTSAMDLRLVPVGRVFSRFPSLARDLAREQGKRVQVALEGEDTELDKSTTDVLAEPLLHLVRNAVDHGIGTPEVREAQGKPPEGTITLRAVQAGDQVRIEVEDDGAGLDEKAILARAREMGFVRPGEEPPPDEIRQLIFRAGFSTRREADTVSGRGIGMDVVQRTASRLRGSLEVEEVPEGGTRFILRLPLTLAIMPAVLLESGGETLAVPAMEVEETLRNPRPEYVGAAAVIRHRGEIVPVAHPARLFGWTGEALSPAFAAERIPFAVIVRRGLRAAAIAADRLLDQRDIVIKALPPYLGQPRAVSGATVAPDGRVVLLLDAGELVELNLESYRRNARAS